MIRPTTFIAFGLAAALGTGMFKVKYSVQADEQKLVALQQQMVDDQNALHVLHAEWSSETQPQQLGEMAERHLNLKPVTGQQLASFDSLPKRPNAPTTPAAPNAAAPLVASIDPIQALAAPVATPAAKSTAKSSAAKPAGRIRAASIKPLKPARERTVVASVGDSAVDAVLAAMQGNRSEP
ncbi:MAG TPA: hypothetical protein VL574_10095 [Stellaceae bacterium]|nr:hypothetical protein [Stellaceae bacterium]